MERLKEKLEEWEQDQKERERKEIRKYKRKAGKRKGERVKKERGKERQMAEERKRKEPHTPWVLSGACQCSAYLTCFGSFILTKTV